MAGKQAIREFPLIEQQIYFIERYIFVKFSGKMHALFKSAAASSECAHPLAESTSGFAQGISDESSPHPEARRKGGLSLIFPLPADASKDDASAGPCYTSATVVFAAPLFDFMGAGRQLEFP
jgi:hypothetical protein